MKKRTPDHLHRERRTGAEPCGSGNRPIRSDLASLRASGRSCRDVGHTGIARRCGPPPKHRGRQRMASRASRAGGPNEETMAARISRRMALAAVFFGGPFVGALCAAPAGLLVGLGSSLFAAGWFLRDEQLKF